MTYEDGRFRQPNPSLLPSDDLTTLDHPLVRMPSGAPLAKGTAACEANAPSGSVHHDGSPDELADGIDRRHLEAASRQLTGDAPSPQPTSNALPLPQPLNVASEAR
jgi:hypothetical protein